MDSRRPFPRGRFTLLTAPALLGWAFYLVTVLCERHHNGRSPRNEWIDFVEGGSRRATVLMALVALLVAIRLRFGAKRWAEVLAFAIDAVSALVLLSSALFVA